MMNEQPTIQQRLDEIAKTLENASHMPGHPGFMYADKSAMADLALIVKEQQAQIEALNERIRNLGNALGIPW